MNPPFLIDLYSNVNQQCQYQQVCNIYYSYNNRAKITNLVTSLEIRAIRCVTTLCHFGQTWNGYVATHFILLIISAETTATNGYSVNPERFGQNEEPAIEMRNRLAKGPVFSPAVDSIDAI